MHRPADERWYAMVAAVDEILVHV
ncbi:MAG: hypothetical protein JWQ11_1172, partial [Rhizobacter sp.]|nr:hypothetical protein [Rhizobacter sp.]